MKIPVISSMMEKGIMADLHERMANPESQRSLVLVIVCVALFLDNMLYMVIVPIIPIYLDELKSEEYVSTDIQQQQQAVEEQLPQQQTPSMQEYYQQLNKPPSSFQTSEYEISNGHRKEGSIKVFENGTRMKLRRKTTPFYNSSYYNESTKLVGKTIPILVKYTGERSSDNRVGILFASKALVQLFISPIGGTVIDRIGYDTPMIIGLSIIFVSTTIFAFGRSYGVLFMARSLQGVGSAFADTAGLAMIADRYKENNARSKAQGIALAFISFGSLFAPPFGGFFYKYAGKSVPFLVLSLIALVDGIMLRFVTKPASKEKTICGAVEKKGTPIYKLILDPYIALCAGALVMANISLSFLEPTIARWMKETMNVDELQIGAVWLPPFLPHVLGVYLTVKFSRIYPNKQWLITAIGLSLEGISCFIIPFCTNYYMVILPLMIDCFGIALVDTAILPTLAYLVDHRHASVYGSVYAIADVSYCLAYAFGPIMADEIYQKIGFFWLNMAIFVSNILYAPLLFFLKDIYKYNEFESEFEDEGYAEDGTDKAVNNQVKAGSDIPLLTTQTADATTAEDLKTQMLSNPQYMTYIKSDENVPATKSVVMIQNPATDVPQERNPFKGASTQQTFNPFNRAPPSMLQPGTNVQNVKLGRKHSADGSDDELNNLR